MKLVRPSVTNLKMIVRVDCAVSAYSPLPQPINVLAPLVVSGGGSPPLDRHLSSPTPIASIWNKANFSFNQPGLFTGFWVARTQTPTFSNIITLWFSKKPGWIQTQATSTCPLLPTLFWLFKSHVQCISQGLTTETKALGDNIRRGLLQEVVNLFLGVG